MPASDDDVWPTPTEQYEAVARQIDREECLIDTRLLWMMTLQGLLFAARALSASNAGSEPTSENVLFQQGLSVVGISVAALALWGTRAAYRQLDYVTKFFEARFWPKSGEPKIEDQRYLRPYGDKRAWTGGQAPAIGIPLLVIVTWLVLLFVK